MFRGCVGILDDFLCVTREVTRGRNELIKERTATMPIPKVADNQREEGPDQWRASSGYSQPCLVVVRCEKERSLCNATGLGQLMVKPKRVGFRILLGWTGKCSSVGSSFSRRVSCSKVFSSSLRCSRPQLLVFEFTSNLRHSLEILD